MTGPLIEAYPTDDGLVVMVTDPTTARDVAAAWEFAHRPGSGFAVDAHPLFLLDCANVRRAAADTTDQPVVMVQAPAATPQLRLVAGGDQ